METIENIYAAIAQEAVDAIDDEWSILYIEFEYGAGYRNFTSMYQKDDTGDELFEFYVEYSTFQNFKKLHKITTENGSEQWNRAIFTLFPDGEIDCDFSWDQELADEVGSLSEKENLDDELVGEVSNLLGPLKKSAWIPIIAECDDMYEGSKYFGIPWMPKGKKWPVFDREKMTFQLQIDLSELPDEMTDVLGIKEGLLQFFRNEKADSIDTNKDHLVRIVQPDNEDGEYKEIAEPKPVEMLTPEEMERFKSFSIDELRTNPEAIKLKDKLYKNNNKARASTGKKKCQSYRIVSWEKVDDYPHFNEYYEDEEGAAFSDLETALQEIEDEYMNYNLIDEIFDDEDETTLTKYKCSDADKIGGYPYWAQGIETPKFKGEKMELLMQISGINGHGALEADGTGHIFYLPSDPTVLKFIWACT